MAAKVDVRGSMILKNSWRPSRGSTEFQHFSNDGSSDSVRCSECRGQKVQMLPLLVNISASKSGSVHPTPSRRTQRIRRGWPRRKAGLITLAHYAFRDSPAAEQARCDTSASMRRLDSVAISLKTSDLLRMGQRANLRYEGWRADQCHIGTLDSDI